MERTSRKETKNSGGPCNFTDKVVWALLCRFCEVLAVVMRIGESGLVFRLWFPDFSLLGFLLSLTGSICSFCLPFHFSTHLSSWTASQNLFAPDIRLLSWNAWSARRNGPSKQGSWHSGSGHITARKDSWSFYVCHIYLVNSIPLWFRYLVSQLSPESLSQTRDTDAICCCQAFLWNLKGWREWPVWFSGSLMGWCSSSFTGITLARTYYGIAFIVSVFLRC